MIMEYDPMITDRCPQLFDVIRDSYIKNKILYYINSGVRQSTDLKKWTNDFMDEPVSFVEREALSQIKDDADYDVQALNCLKWVMSNITYVGDKLKWKVEEYWQLPEETLRLRTGDCEDGAILMYRLCRLKGIPANRLYLFCGDVQGGGHCWLGYKPRAYPLNYVFLDWCYWMNTRYMEVRHKFYIDKDSKIYEEETTKSNYYKAWFMFNEECNVKKFRYGLGRNSEDLSKANKPELYTN